MAQGEFLLEVRCEEIPARMLEPAIQELGLRLFEELMSRRLAPGEIETAFTPRRLIVVLKKLPAAEPDRRGVMGIEEFTTLASKLAGLGLYRDAISLYETATRVHPDNLALKINLARIRDMNFSEGGAI